MNMKTKMVAVAVGMAAALTGSAMTEAIAYRGQLKSYGQAFVAGAPVSMTFRVYDSEKPDVPLWGRLIPVNVETNGAFYVELSDTDGVPVGDDTMPLAKACASVRGKIEIGLTMPGSQEFSPRQVLGTYSRAEYARYAARADTAAFGGTLSAKRVTVDGDIRVPGGTLKLSERAAKSFAGTIVNVGELPASGSFGGPGQTLVLRGGVSGWGDSRESDRDRLGLKVVKDGDFERTETVFYTAGESTEEDVVSVQSF